MGFYKQREAFLQGLCEAHPLVRHSQPVNPEDEEDKSLRASFFRINDEAELIASVINYIHTPCVVQYGLQGGIISKGGSLRQLNINNWLFLQELSPDPNNPIISDALSEAYETTFNIMQDFIKSILDENEEGGGCGVFKDVDPAKFHWEQYNTPNEGDTLYGWILSFNDETRPSMGMSYLYQ
jgi:hypothetical protein